MITSDELKKLRGKRRYVSKQEILEALKKEVENVLALGGNPGDKTIRILDNLKN